MCFRSDNIFFDEAFTTGFYQITGDSINVHVIVLGR